MPLFSTQPALSLHYRKLNALPDLVASRLGVTHPYFHRLPPMLKA